MNHPPINEYGDHDYPISDIGWACLKLVMDEIERQYWNRNQTDWDHVIDPGFNGVKYHVYGDEYDGPNLTINGLNIRWYKYPGRSTSVDKLMCAGLWESWLREALRILNPTRSPR